MALARGLRIGGWVPMGRAAEDGRIPARYVGLVETESADPAVRTARNVRPRVLNVAGPRASEDPRIASDTAALLEAALPR